MNTTGHCGRNPALPHGAGGIQLAREQSAVDRYGAAGNERRFVGAEKEDRLRGLVGFAKASDGMGGKQRGAHVFGEGYRPFRFR